MKIIRGDKLSPELRRAVLAWFVHRYTRENPCTAGYAGGFRPPVCPPTDEEWLATHAFYVTSKGKLSARHAHCLPAGMGD